jgi:small subunit ribosomal protein S8
MSIDSIGDFLTVMRNALMVSKRSATVPYSKMKHGIASVLEKEGFIKESETTEDESGKKYLTINFKYVKGKPAIHEIKRISTPGRRRYEGLQSMTRVIGGLGISILSTNSGIITDKEARKLAVGGEVLCHIW